MPHRMEDRVLELSTTTGTGAMALGGALTGYRSFASVLTVADTLPYYIEAVDADGNPSGDFEWGLGTYSGVNTLTRTTVRGSSAGGAEVSFTSGSKVVGLGVPAPYSAATRNEWRNAIRGGYFTLTSGATVNTDVVNGVAFALTLGTNAALANPTNMADGMSLMWRIKQDGTGSRTLSYGSKFKFPGGTAPVLSTAAGAVDVLSGIYNAADDMLECNMLKAFA